MKTSLNVCMLFLFASHVLCAFTESSGHGQLTSLRYGKRQGFTRMTIGLEGSATVSSGRQGNIVKLVMGNTMVKSSYDGARLRFSFGPVDVVRVNQVNGDSVVVSIQLKKDARFNIQREKNMNLLFVDFYADSVRTIAPKANHSDGHKYVPSISSAAKKPIDNDTTRVIVTHPGSPEQVKITRSSRTGEENGFPWLKLTAALAAIIVAGLGTWAILSFSRQRPVEKKDARTPLTEQRQSVVDQSRFSSGVNGYAQHRPNSDDTPQDRGLIELDSESSTLALAKRYGRGRGELDLSFNLQTHQSKQWSQFVDKLRESSVTQQINIAKQFGIGRGEVDLAIRMHQLKPTGTTGMEKV